MAMIAKGTAGKSGFFETLLDFRNLFGMITAGY
jgi:hypothetical protein